MKVTLMQILSDALKTRKILTRNDIFALAESNGFLQSTAERAFRYRGESTIPCIKLNSKRKPIKHDEFAMYYKWAGGETKFKL